MISMFTANAQRELNSVKNRLESVTARGADGQNRSNIKRQGNLRHNIRPANQTPMLINSSTQGNFLTNLCASGTGQA